MKSIIKQQLVDSINTKLPQLVQREYRLPDISNKTHAIIGMRRSGKTYFLYQIMKKILKQSPNKSEKLDRSRLVYFNFEDERLEDLTGKNMGWIIDEYYALFPANRSKKVYFFFDEIQLVEGWERFIRRLMDSEKVQIYISGSSSKMLSSEIASSMRGRSISTVIYPFSFREFLRSQRIDLPESEEQLTKEIRSLFENKLLEYLYKGGFPEAQNLIVQDRNLLLQSYVNTVLLRDIIERYNVKNILILKKLARYLIKNYSLQFTVNKFFNQLKSQGIKVSKTSLYEYLDYLQDSFLIHSINIFTESERKRMVNPIKNYVIDTGLANAFAMKQNINTGHLLENAVFMELCRRNSKISYLNTRSGFEIDFIAEYPDGSVEAIQVSADISDPKTRERELRPFFEINKILPDAKCTLINLSEENIIETDNIKINVIPAWKFLYLLNS